MSRSNKQIREKYYKSNPYCFWCGIKTVLEHINRNANNLATLDHIFHKFHPSRQFCGKTVLACNQCNSDRNYIALRLLPILIDEEPEEYEVRKMARIKIDRNGLIYNPQYS